MSLDTQRESDTDDLITITAIFRRPSTNQTEEEVSIAFHDPHLADVCFCICARLHNDHSFGFSEESVGSIGSGYRTAALMTIVSSAICNDREAV